MKKHIPNLLTSLNLFSGCIATVMAFNHQYEWVLVWVLIGGLFDFFDGFVARMLNAHSPIGKDLDSLADVVSFGLAPAMVVFAMLTEKATILSHSPIIYQYVPYIAFILTIFSALRLAKFNIDERQSDSFIGLNTPSNAIFWTSFVCGIMTNDRVVFTSGLMYTVLIGIVVFSLLMTSEIPMFSLKVKSWKFKGNEQRYFLVLFIIVTCIFAGALGLAAGILLYIALSILDNRNKVVR